MGYLTVNAKRTRLHVSGKCQEKSNAPQVETNAEITPLAIRDLKPGWYRDGALRHLFLRVGAKPKRRNAYGAMPRPKHSFYFQYEARRDGRRIFVSKRLDNVIHLDEARSAARIFWAGMKEARSSLVRGKP